MNINEVRRIIRQTIAEAIKDKKKGTLKERTNDVGSILHSLTYDKDLINTSLLGGHYMLNFKGDSNQLIIDMSKQPDQKGKSTEEQKVFTIVYRPSNKKWDLSDSPARPTPDDQKILDNIADKFNNALPDIEDKMNKKLTKDKNMNINEVRSIIRQVIAEAMEDKKNGLPKSGGKLVHLKKELQSLKGMRESLGQYQIAEGGETSGFVAEYAHMQKFVNELEKIKAAHSKLAEMLDNQISEVEGKVSSETEKVKEMMGLIEKAKKPAAKKDDKKAAKKDDKKEDKKEEPKEEKPAAKKAEKKDK